LQPWLRALPRPLWTDPGSRIQLDVFGRGSFTFRNPLSNNTSSIEVPSCESTGALESWVFEYIQGSLGV